MANRITVVYKDFWNGAKPALEIGNAAADDARGKGLSLPNSIEKRLNAFQTVDYVVTIRVDEIPVDLNPWDVVDDGLRAATGKAFHSEDVKYELIIGEQGPISKHLSGRVTH